MFETKLIGREDWKTFFAEEAHALVFAEKRSPELDRIDFALLLVDKEDSPVAFVTCREQDEESLYMQYGGAMPLNKKTYGVSRGYEQMIEFVQRNPKYKRLATRIGNENIPMLRLAMGVGFRVVGVTTHKGDVLLELILEFGTA